MPEMIRLARFADDRGVLSVLDGILPFPVRRVYIIDGVPPGKDRAGHRHRRNRQALVCVAGRCEARVHDGRTPTDYRLDEPGKCLLLEPTDWHLIHRFSPGAVLLVLASEPYDPSDCIREPCP